MKNFPRGWKFQADLKHTYSDPNPGPPEGVVWAPHQALAWRGIQGGPGDVSCGCAAPVSERRTGRGPESRCTAHSASLWLRGCHGGLRCCVNEESGGEIGLVHKAIGIGVEVVHQIVQGGSRERKAVQTARIMKAPTQALRTACVHPRAFGEQTTHTRAHACTCTFVITKTEVQRRETLPSEQML